MGHSKSSSKREIHSIIGLSQETRKNLKQLTIQLKDLEKKQQTKPRVGRRKEIIKIRVEINDIELLKKKINETKS